MTEERRGEGEAGEHETNHERSRGTRVTEKGGEKEKLEKTRRTIREAEGQE